MVSGGSREPRASPGARRASRDLGIPDLVLADGPNGVGNGATGVTAFPAAVSSSATWDTALVHRYGAGARTRAGGQGQQRRAAPTINILRVPQWGRSFETFSEDPHLSAEMATAEITGVQREGVIADAKHFAANNQEIDRAFNDMEVPERALREIYLPAFEAAVKAPACSGMCAYNRVAACTPVRTSPLMTDILKNEWGFRGFVVSDWAATHISACVGQRGARPGDADGPAPDYPQFFGDPLKDDVQAGRVPMARLDDMVDAHSHRDVRRRPARPSPHRGPVEGRHDARSIAPRPLAVRTGHRPAQERQRRPAAGPEGPPVAGRHRRHRPDTPRSTPAAARRA